MAIPCVKVASGGLPVTVARGAPFEISPSGFGIPVTVVASGGLPITDATPGGGLGGGGTAYATWDTATATNVTLSGGNLVATNTGTTSVDQGAHVAAASGKTSGKYYFELQYTTIINGTGSNQGLGIGTTASTYSAMGNNATTGNLVFRSGTLYAGGSSTGISLSGMSNGNIIGIAVDLDNRKIWFKRVNGAVSTWNNNGSADPATNVGGQVIPAGTMVPFCTYGGPSSPTPGDVYTANFGASAFTGAVPSGFTSGWTA